MLRRIFLIFIIFPDTRKKFKLILIKFGFFYEFLKLLKNQAKVPVLSTWPTSSEVAKIKFSIFEIFSDAYTCSDDVYSP